MKQIEAGKTHAVYELDDGNLATAIQIRGGRKQQEYAILVRGPDGQQLRRVQYRPRKPLDDPILPAATVKRQLAKDAPAG